MKKILLLTLEFPPDRGGVARYYGGLVGAMPAGSVVVMRARLSRWIWPRWLPLLWLVAWKMYRERVSEVWVGHILPLGTVVYLLRKLSVVPTLSRILDRIGISCQLSVFTHGMDILVPQSSARKIWLIKRILGDADRVVTISRFTQDELLQIGVPEKKIVIIPPCSAVVPPLNIRGGEGELRKKYNVENKKILLTVARLVERKGIDLVIAALHRLFQTKSRTVGDLVYVIVGDGPEREKLKITQLLNYQIIFTGAVSDDELSAWYDACDVFIMTPRQIGGDVEGFGLVYLEANAHGKPVIGSRSGGVPDAVVDGETGLLVDEGDVEGIAKAIERLFSDDALRKKLGEQGRTRVKREFQWEMQSKKISLFS